MVQDDMRRRGYDKEKEYFFRLNQELIEKRRRELDAERAAHPQSQEIVRG